MAPWRRQRRPQPIRRRRVGFERLESRRVLDGTARPFIDLGPSDNVALDQPRVTVEFGNASGQSIGPDIFNSWLLDTGANTVLAFQTAIDDMNQSPPAYAVEGKFEEIGVGGTQLFDISAPYQLDFAGSSGIRQTLPGARIISDATRDVSMFGPFGIVGMPAMTERVTTLDFTPWEKFNEGNFLMQAEFAMEVPAAAGPRYSVSIDDRVSFSPDGHVIEGEHPPIWADIPFFTVDVHHGGKVATGNFMFDTGAQVTIISRALAFSLGLDSNLDGVLDSTDVGYTRTETVGGVGGSRDAPVFMIDSVHVPTDQGVDLVWTDLLWLVVDIAPGIDGVFGFDNMTSGWIEATIAAGAGGGTGYLRQAHLDFRGWETLGSGTIHFDLNPELAAVQLPEGPGAVIVEPGGTTTVGEAGQTDTYTVALRARPSADVVVQLVTKPAQLSAHPAGDPTATSIRFTPDDWDVPRTIVVQAVDDAVEQSLHRSGIRHVATSADPAYDGVGMPQVLVNIIDDDFAAVMVLPTDLQTDVAEGGATDTYSVVLVRAPTVDVSVALVPSGGQVTATSVATGATSLVFTPTNWNVPQAVLVAAVDDTSVEGPHRAYVSHQITTGDEQYSQAYALPEIVFITDDDTPPVATPPTVVAAATAVSGAVGDVIAVDGTWGSPDPGHAVTLAASRGTVTKNADGSWAWSIVTSQPLGAEVVTITATDDRGLTAQAAFAVTARAAPTGLLATPGDGRVSLAWTRPAATPGLPVIGYRVESSLDDGVSWTTILDTAGAAIATEVLGLANGTPRRFRVAALDASGQGPFSDPSATTTPAGLPATPQAPGVTGGDGAVMVQWEPPADNGSAIIDYVLESSTDDGATWLAVVPAPGGATTLDVTGLANGSRYRFRVAATNGVGTGSRSAASAAVIPAGLPAAADAPTATGGAGTARVTWARPADNGSAIVDYLLDSSTDDGTSWSRVGRIPAAETSFDVNGLDNGAVYRFRITATNGVGAGAPSPASLPVVPLAPPAAPADVGLTPGDGRVTVSWAAPVEDGGTTILEYRLEMSVAGGPWGPVPRLASAALTEVVVGLANGTTHHFRVAAVNAVGVGAFGPPVGCIPSKPAGVPTALVARRGDASVTLTWKAPAVNGGSPIVDYRIEASTDGGKTWTPHERQPSAATTATVAGLVNGTSVVFRVSAVNAVGPAAFSPKSIPVVPARVPDAVSALSAVRGDRQARLSWTLPASSGGLPLRDHAVEWSIDGGATWKIVAHAPTTVGTIVVRGLVNGRGYLFRVGAANALGVGERVATVQAVTPATLPGSPWGVVAVRGDGQVALSWKGPKADGGSPVTDYRVESSRDGGKSWQDVARVTATGTVAMGLSNGTAYQFRVSATNAVGPGAAVRSAVVVPATIPGMPTEASATRSGTTVTVSWSAPLSDGGRPITFWHVEWSVDDGATWKVVVRRASPLLRVTLAALPAEGTHRIRISAANAVGRGPAAEIVSAPL